MMETSETRKGFPNLARHITTYNSLNGNEMLLPEAQSIFEEVNATIRAELMEAGFPAKIDYDKRPEQGLFEMWHDLEHIRMKNGFFPEVPPTVVGFYNRWTFNRAWYFYVVKGPGIPPQLAEEFHQVWGKEVRVAGDCSCPSPLEAFHGFAVDGYHIDTPAGLKAFTELLDKIYV